MAIENKRIKRKESAEEYKKMPYSTGTFEDSILIEILKRGKQASKNGISREAWYHLIDEELQPFRNCIHIDAESFFNQFLTLGFVREAKIKGLYCLCIHWAPRNRQRKYRTNEPSMLNI